MTKQKTIIFAAISLVIVLCVTIGFGLHRSSYKQPLAETSLGASVSLNESIPKGESISANKDITSEKMDSKPHRPSIDELEMKDSEIVRLHEFLDANDTESILAQAEFLAASEDPIRRNSVIRPLLWVNNAAAARILVPLLSDPDEAIASEAKEALEHILRTFQTQISLNSETKEIETPEDVDINEVYDVTKEALLGTTDEDSLDDLMLCIATMDVQVGLPLLLEVLENGSDWQKSKAQEYIDFVTQDDGVTNREEAVIWLQKEAGLIEDTTDDSETENDSKATEE